MKKLKSAIITGIGGQCASYLAEYLLSLNYIVYGLVRRNSINSIGCSEHLSNEQNLKIVEGDILDFANIQNLIKLAKPELFFNLCAQSHVGTSFNQPVYTSQVNAIGVLNCLEAIKNVDKSIRFFQASTSEMFGGLNGQDKNTEETPFYPRSPYSVAKLYGHWITKNYRESYNMFCSTGLTHNNESPRRGPKFVTRKITLAVANIVNGNQDILELGNLSARRDWGHSQDYVKGFYKILQYHKPDDFVIATGETHSVEEFCSIAFEKVGLPILFSGENLDKVGKDQNGIVRVKVNPKYYRPAEVPSLTGDFSKAKRELGWSPEISFEELVEEMVLSDIELTKNKK